MRGSPTNSFLAVSLRHTAAFLKAERRPKAAKWLNLAAERLERLDCQVRNEQARSDFIVALEADRENTLGLYPHNDKLSGGGATEQQQQTERTPRRPLK